MILSGKTPICLNKSRRLGDAEAKMSLCFGFSFNGKSLPNDITIEIYDKNKTESDRVLLKSFSEIQGKNILVESAELNKTYQSKKNTNGRLKRVFVNYVITAVAGAQNKQPTMKERGAVVLVMGYKN